MANHSDQKKRDILMNFDTVSASARGRSWFFGIGINRYEHFPPLNNAVKDIQDMEKLLLADYDFTPEFTITLYDEQATREKIIESLDRLQREVAPTDKLLIYYSGHGHLNKEIGKGYWIPTDAERDNTAEYIRNSTIREYMETLKALHTLLISDSCFSGSLFVRGASRSSAALNELGSLPSRWAICSGRHDEEVFDGEPGGNSPFAESIMDTLRRNAKREFNVAKLVDQVVEQTRANYQQLPEGNPLYGVGHKGGQYIFRRRADEAEDWAAAQAAGTLPAFRQFLENHPEGQWSTEAREMIAFQEEEAAWEKATSEHTILAYFEYDQAYPGGRYHGLALDLIAELEEEVVWKDALRRDKLSAYRKYTSEYPQGKYLAEADAYIAAIASGTPLPASPRPKAAEKTSPSVHPEEVRPIPASVSPSAALQIRKWLPIAVGALVLILAVGWAVGRTSGSSPGEQDSVMGHSPGDSEEGVTTLSVGVDEGQENPAGGEAARQSRFTGPLPAFVINVGAFSQESQAQAEAKALTEKGYFAGYLWLPDYPSLSDTKMYSVFIGPFFSEEACGKAVQDYRKVNPDAYGLKVSRENERVEIRGVNQLKRMPSVHSKN